jgi:short chain dehydrogenase
MNEHAKPPFPRQKQPMPGKMDAMEPVPDHGEKSYRGSGRLSGKKAIITGADSGIGRAVAIAYAREGADVLIAYLNEHDDAKQTERLVRGRGQEGCAYRWRHTAGEPLPRHCQGGYGRAGRD